MPKVALVETKPSRTDFRNEFEVSCRSPALWGSEGPLIRGVS